MKKKLSHQIAIAFMKISIIPALILILAMCSYAKDGSGQKLLDTRLTLKFNQGEMKNIFAEIEKISDVRFVYSPELIESSRKVSIDAKNKELSKILSKLLSPLNIKYEVINNYIILRKVGESADPVQTMSSAVIPVTVPTIKIKGKIRTSSGQSLEGVSVVLKGAPAGTTTNAKGEFNIEVPNENSILVISFVGFQEQEIYVGNKTSIDVVLLGNSELLNDVVVIGYGTQKKVNVTGAIASVTGKDIKIVPVPSISNSLVGRLTGVIGVNPSGEPGYDDANILIRGLSTMGNSGPLIVIDGVADRAGGFSRLDVNDIDNITVLKDASAAIYGSRSANGVLLITTKRGGMSKPTVNFTFNYGLRQPTRLPKMLGSPEYAQAVNELEIINYNRPARYTDADITKFKDGSDPYGHPNTNWETEALKPLSSQFQQNISVSGGSDKVKYFFSVGNQYQDGYYRSSATNYKQYNVRSNIDAQIANNFKMFLNLSARQENRSFPYNGSGTIFNYVTGGVPTAPAFLPGTNLPGLPLGGDINPVDAVTSTMGYQKDQRTYLNGDIGFTLDMPYITKGLSIIGGLYVDKSFKFYKSWYKNHNLYELNQANGDTIVHVFGPGNAQLNENMNQDLGLTANIRLNYSHTFNNEHEITAFVAYEQYQYSYDSLEGTRSNYVSTQIDQLFAGGNDKLKDNYGSASAFARQNYFGRVGYDYRNKYLFQFNWRYDGTVNFPSSNRWGFFPGVAVGWRLSSEEFMKDVKWVDNLKLRASYGKLGNDNILPFQYIATYPLSSGGVFGGASPVLSTSVKTGVLANPNVTWEVANTYNLGMDATLFNNAITLTVELFKTKRTNILWTQGNAIPDYLGLAQNLPSENTAEAENKGYEIQVNYRKSFGDVLFSAGVNFTYNKSEILNIGEASNIPSYQKITGKPIDAFTGNNGSGWLLMQSIGIYRSQADLDKYPHVANAQLGDLIFKDQNGDGVIDGLDRVRQTNTSTPKLVYGIPIDVQYKGFDLNMFWQGQAMSNQYVYFNSGEIGNFLQDYYDNHWTTAKPNASGPRLYDREDISSTQNPNTYFYRDASFIRLKSLQLAYSLSKKTLSKLPISALQIYLSGFNLLTFDKLKYIDPEGQGGTGGTSYAAWYTPQTRIYNIGLNVTF